MSEGTNVVVPLDHPVTVVLTAHDGRVVHREDTTAEQLAGCVTRLRITWNALGVQGGSRWVHPGTGEWFPSGLGYHVEWVDPYSGETLSGWLQ